MSWPDTIVLTKINLVVGDYFKVISGVFMTYTKKATELIAWLRSKSWVLALLREIQKGICLANGSNIKILSVICAVITRWTAHYLAFRCLLDLKQTLEILVSHKKEAPNGLKIIVAGNATSRKKGSEIIKIIEDSLFWHTILRFVTTDEYLDEYY